MSNSSSRPTLPLRADVASEVVSRLLQHYGGTLPDNEREAMRSLSAELKARVRSDAPDRWAHLVVIDENARQSISQSVCGKVWIADARASDFDPCPDCLALATEVRWMA